MVEVDERADELASILTARGFDVTVDGGVLLLGGDDDGVHDAVRDAVADLGVGLRRLGPRGRTLEDVYLGRVRDRGQDAQLFDLGYRGYDGARERPARAILTLAVFTMRRVLGSRARRAPQGAAGDHARDRVPARARLGRVRVDRRTGSSPTT